jgi:hypothetical protein
MELKDKIESNALLKAVHVEIGAVSIQQNATEITIKIGD